MNYGGLLYKFQGLLVKTSAIPVKRIKTGAKRVSLEFVAWSNPIRLGFPEKVGKRVIVEQLDGLHD